MCVCVCVSIGVRVSICALFFSFLCFWAFMTLFCVFVYHEFVETDGYFSASAFPIHKVQLPDTPRHEVTT